MSLKIEKLIENGYDYSLINQIQKAYDKGYDITEIDKSVDPSKLRSVISELPTRETMDKHALFDILLKTYGAEGKIRHAFKLKKSVQDTILKGLKEGVNPNAYKYIGSLGFEPKWVTDVALHGIYIGVDVYEYFLKGYDASQTEQILIALENDFNIEKFITPKDNITEIIAMNKLCEFYDSKKIKKDKLFCDICELKLKRKVMDKVLECLEDGADISIIFSELVNKKQIGILLTAIKKGLNIETMIDKRLTPEQLNSIMTGIEHGVDTTLFNNPAYSLEQMNAIFKLLRWNKNNPERELDVNPILNPKVPDYLMSQYLDYHKMNDSISFKHILGHIERLNRVKHIER